MPTDAQLMGRVRGGDANAFDEIFARHREPVRLYLLRATRDEQAAEDLGQEVFLRVWTKAETFIADAPFNAWLYRIAINLALNHARTVHRRRQQPLEFDDEGIAPGWMADAAALGPQEVAAAHEERAMLRRLIDQLPEGKRAAMKMV